MFSISLLYMNLNPIINKFIRNDKYTFLRFILIGGLNTFLGWCVFSLTFLICKNEAISLFSSILFALIFNFLSHGIVVFRSLPFSKYFIFASVYFLLYFVNYFILRIVLHLSNFSPILIQLLVVPIIAILSFILLSKLVFVSSHKNDYS